MKRSDLAKVHSPAIIEMLQKQGELFGVDASTYFVYGSPMRPMSATWARIDDAMFVPANSRSTGYHTYVVVPAELHKETIERYELEFVSHPATTDK